MELTRLAAAVPIGDAVLLGIVGMLLFVRNGRNEVDADIAVELGDVSNAMHPGNTRRVGGLLPLSVRQVVIAAYLVERSEKTADAIEVVAYEPIVGYVAEMLLPRHLGASPVADGHDIAQKERIGFEQTCPEIVGIGRDVDGPHEAHVEETVVEQHLIASLGVDLDISSKGLTAVHERSGGVRSVDVAILPRTVEDVAGFDTVNPYDVRAVFNTADGQRLGIIVSSVDAHHADGIGCGVELQHIFMTREARDGPPSVGIGIEGCIAVGCRGQRETQLHIVRSEGGESLSIVGQHILREILSQVVAQLRAGEVLAACDIGDGRCDMQLACRCLARCHGVGVEFVEAADIFALHIGVGHIDVLCRDDEVDIDSGMILVGQVLAHKAHRARQCLSGNALSFGLDELLAGRSVIALARKGFGDAGQLTEMPFQHIGLAS